MNYENWTREKYTGNLPLLSVGVRHLGHGFVVTLIATLLASSHLAYTKSTSLIGFC